jgi:hypothetical protein
VLPEFLKLTFFQNEGFVVVAIATRFDHVKPPIPHPHLLMIDAATKRVSPKLKKAKIKAFLDEFRDQIKGKCNRIW